MKYPCRFLGLLVVLLFGSASTFTYAAPYTPAYDNVVIERLPFKPRDAVARELGLLRAALLKSPGDPVAVGDLASRYFSLSAELGDPRYVGYADALIQPFSANIPASLLVLRGMIRQYRHDFSEALEDFANAIKIDKDLASPHAWRGAIYLVQANYASAARECDALKQLRSEVLHGGCWGLTQAYSGSLADAYKTLEQTLPMASTNGQRLWINTRLGEVAAWRGDVPLARQHFEKALKLGLDDTYLLAAWSDFLLDQGQAAQVVKLLTPWTAVDGLLLRLAEAQTQLNQAVAKTHVQTLMDRFAAAKMRRDTTHQAEEARFYLRLLHDPQEALRLAQSNYQVQKEPRDARILLESALAAANPDAAKPAMQWLQSNGFQGIDLQKLAQQVQQLPK